MSELDLPANSSPPLNVSGDDIVNDHPKKESTNIYVFTLFVFVTIAILVLNGYIIGLMKYHKQVLKKSFSLHILSLCFTDFIVGLSGIPFIYNYINQQEIDYSVCASIFGTYIICQVVALFHILGFCIYRVLILKDAQQPPKWKRQYLSYHVPAMWIVIPVFLSLPFILWGQVGETMTFCSVDTLFRPNYNKAMSYIIAFFWGPVVLTNSFYLYLQIVLLKRIKRINPSTGNIEMSARGYASSQGILIQMRTLRTIGLVLLLLDVLTLPLNVAILLEISIDSISLSRKQRLVSTILTYFNSAINPLIYAARIPELRDCMMKPFRVFWQWLIDIIRP